MRHHNLLPILLILLLTTGLGVAQVPPPPPQPQATPAAPRAPQAIPAPPTVPATAYLLMDFHSGRVLAESNPDQRLEPASLTKIMTAHVVFQELKAGHVRLEDEVLISKKAWRTGGSRTFIEVDKRVPLEILLKGMIIQSGNDASVALAEHVAGSEETFAQMMNDDAKRLGMTGSHFVNSTGLPDPNHYSTARDLAKIAAATIREFPEYYPWYAIKELDYNNIKQHNRNRLLGRDESVDGVKTGHTEAAGFCLVASAKRDEMRLISVVMGTKGEEARAVHSLALLNYGFRFYESRKLLDKRQEVATLRVWNGDPAELPVGPAEAVYATLPREQTKNVEARIELEPTVMAPVAAGQPVGRVLLERGEQKELVGEVPLVALREAAEGGIFRRGWDSLLLWFK